MSQNPLPPPSKKNLKIKKHKKKLKIPLFKKKHTKKRCIVEDSKELES
jgi:hypothetical protein